MELSKLVEEILKITNESPYGWLDMDSVEAGEIWKLLNKEKQAEQLTSTDVVKCNCKTPRPQMKVSENGISGYCANCAEPL